MPLTSPVTISYTNAHGESVVQIFDCLFVESQGDYIDLRGKHKFFEAVGEDPETNIAKLLLEMTKRAVEADHEIERLKEDYQNLKNSRTCKHDEYDIQQVRSELESLKRSIRLLNDTLN